jgi:hypothetical protein
MPTMRKNKQERQRPPHSNFCAGIAVQQPTRDRPFTDEELDRAAPFSLSFGAPVTAQFVIEDHALRHNWHHLARIRTVLSR